jgi:hypothetical protein
MTPEEEAEIRSLKEHPSMVVGEREQKWARLGNASANEIAIQLAAIEALDPSQYYCRTVDDKGHSVEVRVKLPAYMAGPLGYIVDQIPAYRSPADVLRDGATKLIRQLVLDQENNAIDPQPLAAMFITVCAEKAKADLDDHKTALEAISDAVHAYGEAGDWEALSLLLERFGIHALQMRDPFRTRIIKRLEWAARILKRRKLPVKRRTPKRGR